MTSNGNHNNYYVFGAYGLPKELVLYRKTYEKTTFHSYIPFGHPRSQICFRTREKVTPNGVPQTTQNDKVQIWKPQGGPGGVAEDSWITKKVIKAPGNESPDPQNDTSGY